MQKSTIKKKKFLFLEVVLILALISVGIGFFLYKLPQVSATTDEFWPYMETAKYLVKNLRFDQSSFITHPPLSFYLFGWVTLFPFDSAQSLLLVSRLTRLPL